MTRAVLVQLALFAAIAVGCGLFVLNTLFGTQPVRPLERVSVVTPDAAGLAPGSQVSYRGVFVGTVSAVAIDPGGQGVRLDLRLDAGRRIPVASRAVISVDTPMAIQHLDLQPNAEQPPYLSDGSVIGPQQTARPLPLSDVLVDFDRATRGIDGRDVSRLSRALATGLNGQGPELGRIVDNTREVTEVLRQHQPQITDLLGQQGPGALSRARETTGELPELSASMRRLADGARAQEPTLARLTRTAPDVAEQIDRLTAANQPAVTSLLGNAVTTAQIVNSRTPAVAAALDSVPRGAADLANLEHNGVADFYLVAAQGPACAYDTPRRPPTDTSPRNPRLDQSCAPAPGRAQRGAETAPIPSNSSSSGAGQ